MQHYVCTGGCGGVSDQPGVCQDESCPMGGQPLTPCNCEDGKHAEVLGQHQNESADSEENK